MTTLTLPDMSCGHCKATVEKTIRALSPDAVMAFDMAARKVALQGAGDVGAIRTALAAAGYPAASD